MKTRISIPKQIVADIVVKSFNYCNLCYKHTDDWQIHHIDEDPSNNDPDNLVFLCLNCHSKIHTKRSMSGNYTKEIIKTYRDQLYKIIKSNIANILEIKETINSENSSYIQEKADESCFAKENPQIFSLVINMKDEYKLACKRAQILYDAGGTYNVLEGNFLEINCISGFIDEMIKSYPEKHFLNEKGEDIINNIYKSYDELAYRFATPEGFVNAGTMVHSFATRTKIELLKSLVNIIVEETIPYDDIVRKLWKPI